MLYAEGRFDLDEVRRALAEFGLPPDTPLTALAAELFADPPEEDPLGADLGKGRLLRVSPLATMGLTARSSDSNSWTRSGVALGLHGSSGWMRCMSKAART